MSMPSGQEVFEAVGMTVAFFQGNEKVDLSTTILPEHADYVLGIALSILCLPTNLRYEEGAAILDVKTVVKDILTFQETEDVIEFHERIEPMLGDSIKRLFESFVR